jgi:hypothetical protein
MEGSVLSFLKAEYQNEMSNPYRGPSIDASYQISVHLAKRFQRRIFNKINQSETRTALGGHVCLWIGTKLAIFTEDLPFSSETALPNEPKLGRYHLCAILYKYANFFPIH